MILKLLARLLTKLRLISYETNQVSHFQLTYISKSFVNLLIQELKESMNASDSLHPAMTQDAVEFFMTFVVPLPGQNLKTLKDLLEDIELPNWLLPIVHVSHYLHYFKGDLSSLPSDTIKVE